MDCKGPALARPTLVHEPTCVPRSGHGSSLDLCASLGQAPLHLDGGHGRSCRSIRCAVACAFSPCPKSRVASCVGYTAGGPYVSVDMVGCRRAESRRHFGKRSGQGELQDPSTLHFRRRKWIGAQRLEVELGRAKDRGETSGALESFTCRADKPR